MKPDFDYETVPYGFIHCLNGQCQHAADCLRHQVALRVPSKCTTFTIVNPSHSSPDGKDCPFFMLDRLEPFALGITKLLDSIPHSDAIIIKSQMITYLKRATYYRCWRKERLVKPCEQEYIRQLFLGRGLTEKPVYDQYVEQYNW